MELDFESGLFICIAISTLFLIGYGLVSLLGLGVMKVLDRTAGKKKWYVVGRCL